MVGIDYQTANILPTLLEQLHEVINGNRQVLNEVFSRHVNIADSHSHGKHRTELKLYGRLGRR